MDGQSYTFDTDTVNPADLLAISNDGYFPYPMAAYAGSITQAELSGSLAERPTRLPTVDSAVDLSKLSGTWYQPDHPTFFPSEDQSAQASASPSPPALFSNANSPGLPRLDRSQISSPESTDSKPSTSGNDWRQQSVAPSPIQHRQMTRTPEVSVLLDKYKTRAETQITVTLQLERLDSTYQYIHFPRRTLAKPKHLASAEEEKEAESAGDILHMELMLVCATAIQDPDRHDELLRRARGPRSQIPRRKPGVAIGEIEKDDPAHPQNGGEVVICEGCKERERKRHDRKKKRGEDEEDWMRFESDRVVMINEKEYKKFDDHTMSVRSTVIPTFKVQFAMRIACYCRHQELKSPVGYKVIFTLKDNMGNCVVQHTSDIIQITDDHKNRDLVPDAPPQPSDPPLGLYSHGSNSLSSLDGLPQEASDYSAYMAAYSQPPTPLGSRFPSPLVSPINTQFSQVTINTHFSQTTTPINTQFSQATTPINTQFPQQTTPINTPFPQVATSTGMPPPHSAPTFQPISIANNSLPYTRLQGQSGFDAFDVPMMSPSSQVTLDGTYIPRPISMESITNYNMASQQYAYRTPGFASAPQTTVSTPISRSRPASPTWDQGPGPSRRRVTDRHVWSWAD